MDNSEVIILSECSICYQLIKNKKDYISLECGCSAIYHKTCLKKVFVNSCPVCGKVAQYKVTTHKESKYAYIFLQSILYTIVSFIVGFTTYFIVKNSL